MRALWAFLLLLLAVVAHAGKGDFIKATVHGNRYELRADNVAVYHLPGGTEHARYQSYYFVVSDADPVSGTRRVVMGFELPVGVALSPGTYPVQSIAGMLWAEPAFGVLRMEEDAGINCTTMDDAKGGEVIITAVHGPVIEGVFHARLHSWGVKEVWEVTNGAFRFTMP